MQCVEMSIYSIFSLSWPAELCTVRASRYIHGKFCCVARILSRDSINSATWTMILIEEAFVNTMRYRTVRAMILNAQCAAAEQ